jgi:hypothetical protein
MGVNDQGQIVGSYRDINGLTHGFLVNPDASVVSIDYPSNALGSVVSGISDSGLIVGIYTDTGQKTHGFLRSADGTTFTSFDVPNSLQGSTIVIGVDNAGDIVGTFQDSNKNFHGFLRSADGSSYTIIDAPGTTSGTHVTGINNNGLIVGYFTTPTATHSFIRNASGTSYSIFDAPDATLSTDVSGINDAGQTVGFFYGATGIHNFLRSADGTSYVTFDDPSVPPGDSFSTGLNDLGEIVGYSMESFDHYHGFVAVSASVPEPASASLLGLGILFVMCAGVYRSRTRATSRLEEM